MRDDWHVAIENVTPQVDCGRYRAKAITGDRVVVEADIYRDSTAMLAAVVRFRGPTGRWAEQPLSPAENDHWIGSFVPTRPGIWKYFLQAWTDRFGTWRRDLEIKATAGVDVELDLAQGALLIEERLESLTEASRPRAETAIERLRAAKPGDAGPDADPRVTTALDPDLYELMAGAEDRTAGSTSPILELTVDRERARFGAWYEMFPRSTGTESKSGTFKTAAAELSRVADMGFDVVYLPPIHPIGKTNRKGKNNSLECSPKDVGSPWAIGNEHGGHKAVDPNLGTIKDFDRFVSSAENLGLEIALDFAIQCSPDHPWVTEHPEWFEHLPDGSIRFAENPPKKYQDIYPINFDTEDREGLWNELRSVLEFWIDHGVRIFRVDNPHTKSLGFWEWVIGELKAKDPGLIFLAEAFTRPKVMYALAKLGFTQSYTYFTWRNYKWELEEYMTELTTPPVVDFFRPNFFANTPDILHEYLQTGGAPAFKVRLVLAAVLSPSYGIYSGYELFENVPVREGSEEYLDSEKYQLKPRDFTQPGTLVPYISKINEIRHKHGPLSALRNLHLHDVDKESIMAFSKSDEDGTILVVVNLNPFHWEEGTVDLDLEALGVEPSEPFEVHDLITDTRYVWNGPFNYVRLDPYEEPAHIFR
ncbi:MAG: alpha-1,4-glucan--maltose-1-phosphate maltosyltransferase, partial [Actinomycetota bacterium]|nr:alpha-1,4-glucan--maltose-1-phosphate maltosyltransferase [Actinomycetota bacterium]